jgi:hypothetical protein
LGEIWLNQRDNEDFDDFIAYHDMGLPLAYANVAKYATLSEEGARLVNETFEQLLSGFGMEDANYKNPDEFYEATFASN